MSKKNIIFCDRCEKIANNGPYYKVTFHDHHDSTVDLCKNCRAGLKEFMDPGGMTSAGFLPGDGDVWIATDGIAVGRGVVR